MPHMFSSGPNIFSCWEVASNCPEWKMSSARLKSHAKLSRWWAGKQSTSSDRGEGTWNWNRWVNPPLVRKAILVCYWTIGMVYWSLQFGCPHYEALWRGRFLDVEMQCKDSDELFWNKAWMRCHLLHPGHCGAVIATECNPHFCEGSKDMLYHELQENKPCKFQVQIGYCAHSVSIRFYFGFDVQWPL